MYIYVGQGGQVATLQKDFYGYGGFGFSAGGNGGPRTVNGLDGGGAGGGGSSAIVRSGVTKLRQLQHIRTLQLYRYTGDCGRPWWHRYCYRKNRCNNTHQNRRIHLQKLQLHHRLHQPQPSPPNTAAPYNNIIKSQIWARQQRHSKPSPYHIVRLHTEHRVRNVCTGTASRIGSTNGSATASTPHGPRSNSRTGTRPNTFGCMTTQRSRLLLTLICHPPGWEQNCHLKYRYEQS